MLLPVVMILMLRLANDAELMKGWRNKRFTNILAIVLAVLVSAATVSLFVGG